MTHKGKGKEPFFVCEATFSRGVRFKILSMIGESPTQSLP